MNIDEAKKQQKEYTPPNDEMLNVYCPLIKAPCHCNCVCFCPSKVRPIHVRNAEPGALVGSAEWDLKTYPPHCGNVMFFGEDQ